MSPPTSAVAAAATVPLPTGVDGVAAFPDSCAARTSSLLSSSVCGHPLDRSHLCAGDAEQRKDEQDDSEGTLGETQGGEGEVQKVTESGEHSGGAGQRQVAKAAGQEKTVGQEREEKTKENMETSPGQHREHVPSCTKDTGPQSAASDVDAEPEASHPRCAELESARADPACTRESEEEEGQNEAGVDGKRKKERLGRKLEDAGRARSQEERTAGVRDTGEEGGVKNSEDRRSQDRGVAGESDHVNCSREAKECDKESEEKQEVSQLGRPSDIDGAGEQAQAGKDGKSGEATGQGTEGEGDGEAALADEGETARKVEEDTEGEDVSDNAKAGDKSDGKKRLHPGNGMYGKLGEERDETVWKAQTEEQSPAGDRTEEPTVDKTSRDEKDKSKQADHQRKELLGGTLNAGAFVEEGKVVSVKCLVGDSYGGTGKRGEPAPVSSEKNEDRKKPDCKGVVGTSAAIQSDEQYAKSEVDAQLCVECQQESEREGGRSTGGSPAVMESPEEGTDESHGDSGNEQEEEKRLNSKPREPVGSQSGRRLSQASDSGSNKPMNARRQDDDSRGAASAAKVGDSADGEGIVPKVQGSEVGLEEDRPSENKDVRKQSPEEITTEGSTKDQKAILSDPLSQDNEDAAASKSGCDAVASLEEDSPSVCIYSPLLLLRSGGTRSLQSRRQFSTPTEVSPNPAPVSATGDSGQPEGDEEVSGSSSSFPLFLIVPRAGGGQRAPPAVGGSCPAALGNQYHRNPRMNNDGRVFSQFPDQSCLSSFHSQRPVANSKGAAVQATRPRIQSPCVPQQQLGANRRSYEGTCRGVSIAGSSHSGNNGGMFGVRGTSGGNQSGAIVPGFATQESLTDAKGRRSFDGGREEIGVDTGSSPETPRTPGSVVQGEGDGGGSTSAVSRSQSNKSGRHSTSGLLSPPVAKSQPQGGTRGSVPLSPLSGASLWPRMSPNSSPRLGETVCSLNSLGILGASPGTPSQRSDGGGVLLSPPHLPLSALPPTGLGSKGIGLAALTGGNVSSTSDHFFSTSANVDSEKGVSTIAMNHMSGDRGGLRGVGPVSTASCPSSDNPRNNRTDPSASSSGAAAEADREMTRVDHTSGILGLLRHLPKGKDEHHAPSVKNGTSAAFSNTAHRQALQAKTGGGGGGAGTDNTADKEKCLSGTKGISKTQKGSTVDRNTRGAEETEGKECPAQVKGNRKGNKASGGGVVHAQEKVVDHHPNGGGRPIQDRDLGKERHKAEQPGKGGGSGKKSGKENGQEKAPFGARRGGGGPGSASSVATVVEEEGRKGGRVDGPGGVRVRPGRSEVGKGEAGLGKKAKKQGRSSEDRNGDDELAWVSTAAKGSPMNAQKVNCAEETGASSSSRHTQMSGRPDAASAQTAGISVYVPRSSHQGFSAASSDIWDSPDYDGQKAGSWSAYTLGDIRKVEKAIESGGMSLQEYMQQHQQAKEHKNEESQKKEEEKEDKGTKDAAGHSVRGERKREVWREKGASDIKDKVKPSGGVGLGGVALQDDVEEEFSFFDDHAASLLPSSGTPLHGSSSSSWHFGPFSPFSATSPAALNGPAASQALTSEQAAASRSNGAAGAAQVTPNPPTVPRTGAPVDLAAGRAAGRQLLSLLGVKLAPLSSDDPPQSHQQRLPLASSIDAHSQVTPTSLTQRQLSSMRASDQQHVVSGISSPANSGAQHGMSFHPSGSSQSNALQGDPGNGPGRETTGQRSSLFLPVSSGVSTAQRSHASADMRSSQLCLVSGSSTPASNTGRAGAPSRLPDANDLPASQSQGGLSTGSTRSSLEASRGAVASAGFFSGGVGVKEQAGGGGQGGGLSRNLFASMSFLDQSRAGRRPPPPPSTPPSFSSHVGPSSFSPVSGSNRSACWSGGGASPGVALRAAINSSGVVGILPPAPPSHAYRVGSHGDLCTTGATPLPAASSPSKSNAATMAVIHRHLQTLRRTGSGGSSGGSPTQNPVSPADLLRFIAQLSPKGGEVVAGIHQQLANAAAAQKTGDNSQLSGTAKTNARAPSLGLSFAHSNHSSPPQSGGGGGTASPANQMGFSGSRGIGGGGAGVPQGLSSGYRGGMGAETISLGFSTPLSQQSHGGSEKVMAGESSHRPSAMGGIHEKIVTPHLSRSGSLNVSGLGRNMDMGISFAGSKDNTLNGCVSHDLSSKRLGGTNAFQEGLHDVGTPTDRLSRPSLGNVSTGIALPSSHMSQSVRGRLVGGVSGDSMSQGPLGGSSSVALQQRLAHVLARETSGEASPELARALSLFSPTQRRSGDMMLGGPGGRQGDHKGFDMQQADVLLKALRAVVQGQISAPEQNAQSNVPPR